MTWKYPITINIQKYPPTIHKIHRISQFPGGSQNLKSYEALRLNYARAEADRSDRDRGERGEQREQWERNHRKPGRTGAGPDPKLGRLPLR